MGDQAAVGTEHADGISDEQQADDLRCHHPRRVARPSSLLIVISPGNKVLVPHGVVSALVIFVHHCVLYAFQHAEHVLSYAARAAPAAGAADARCIVKVG